MGITFLPYFGNYHLHKKPSTRYRVYGLILATLSYALPVESLTSCLWWSLVLSITGLICRLLYST